MATCGLSLCFVVVWLKWHVTRAVRDIYETAQSEVEIKRRLCSLVEYMHWRKKDTLSVYEHYFEQQLDQETRDLFLKRLHQEMQHMLENRRQGKRTNRALSKDQGDDPVGEPVPQAASSLDSEPDMSFLYSLAGEA